ERYTPQAMMFAMLALQSQTQIECDKTICGMQKEKFEECKKLLLEAIGNNKPLNNLFVGINIAYNDFHTATITHYYKEGFIYGAQLMLEICGCVNTNKSDVNLGKILNIFKSSQ
ncbi:MAG: hypothetical protein K2O86_01380, partial [Clostridia bacterium]|nr:hypothetical protein [Clostridia bacterium]